MGAQEPHGEQAGHTRQRQESGEQWPCGEQWRWTGCGKPQRRRQKWWWIGDAAQSGPPIKLEQDDAEEAERGRETPKNLYKQMRDGVAPSQGVWILRPGVVRRVAQDVREQLRLSLLEGKQRSCSRDRRLTSGDGRDNLELYELMVRDLWECGVALYTTQSVRAGTNDVGSM
eukprot:6214259-Pleurochrysis_carterae.AAC.2